MSFTDEIKLTCPYCGFEDSLKNFGTWEKDGKRGLLGKTPEGFIIFLCPSCENEIKFDSLSNEFLKFKERKSKWHTYSIFFLILAIIGLFFVIRAIAN